MTSHQWICRRDVVPALTRLFEVAIAQLVPVQYWTPFCTAFGFLRLVSHPRLTVWQLVKGFKLIPNHSRFPDRLSMSVRYAARHVEARFQYLREYSSGGWTPSIRLLGGGHIEKALSGGRGAILWSYPLFGRLALFKALQQAGFSVVHLSHPGHGCVSQSLFARRFLNHVVVDAEKRYLAKRIVVSPEDSLAYLRELVELLKNNDLVSIAVAEYGRRLLEFPFQGGLLRFATGAPYLSISTGAPLLPVFWVRRGPSDFEVVIEAPLDSGVFSSPRRAIDHLSEQYVRLLEGHVVQDPANFWGWDQILSRRVS